MIFKPFVLYVATRLWFCACPREPPPLPSPSLSLHDHYGYYDFTESSCPGAGPIVSREDGQTRAILTCPIERSGVPTPVSALTNSCQKSEAIGPSRLGPQGRMASAWLPSGACPWIAATLPAHAEPHGKATCRCSS